MMWLFLFLFIPFIGYAQVDNDTDSLKKYSYYIFGVSKIVDTSKTVTIFGGTCFFYRDKKSLFLITAKHLPLGCNDSLKKTSNYPDRMFVSLSENISDLLPINTKPINDTAKCPEMFVDPDIIVIPIFDKRAANVYSTEHLFHPRYEQTAKSLISGYPGHLFTEDENIAKPGLTTLTFLNDKSEFIGVRNPATGKEDVIHYWIDQQYYKSGPSMNGLSGSPFFVQNAGTGEWRVAGVFVRSISNPHLSGSGLGFVKIEYVTEKLDQLSTSNKSQ